ncbi:diacylglycerol kinase family protein [Patescibacteria group bacterium]|nr:diacylglycerol kinase family protein [Patescibacteria group bacterium]MBU0964126.1 diacylglycerol kinase family protein [Patescibacteria group bacterium]
MSFIDPRRLIKSFKYAFRGFWFVFKSEQNIRIHLLASVLVVIFIVYFRVELWQAIILLLVMGFVLILELINTVFEKMVDILRPRIHYYAQVIKDIMAAAVLVSSIGAVVIGVLIFAPYIWEMFAG